MGRFRNSLDRVILEIYPTRTGSPGRANLELIYQRFDSFGKASNLKAPTHFVGPKNHPSAP